MLQFLRMQAALASVRSGFRSSNVRLSGVIRSNYVASAPLIESKGVLGQRRMPLNYTRCIAIRAFGSSSDSKNSDLPIAPRSLESPVGQFLVNILVSHPHLMPAAVEHQLQQLQSDRNSEKKLEAHLSASGTDLDRYRRIAEVKANERSKSLEEILYALVIKKFMDANVLLVPSLTSSDPSGRVDTWNTEVENLEKLHSSKAYENIQYHLSQILGDHLSDLNSVAEISKLWVGQIYAGSIIYGYLMKHVDERTRLEQKIKVLPEDLGDEEPRVQNIHSDGGNYVTMADIERILGHTTFRSKEVMNILDKQTKALFGTSASTREEVIKISWGGVKKLVLEAATFGSILWDVESFADSRYPFVER